MDATTTIDGKYGTLEKLKKTSKVLENQIEQSYLQLHGITDMKYGQEQEVYNPMRSGVGQMS